MSWQLMGRPQRAQLGATACDEFCDGVDLALQGLQHLGAKFILDGALQQKELRRLIQEHGPRWGRRRQVRWGPARLTVWGHDIPLCRLAFPSPTCRTAALLTILDEQLYVGDE